MYNTPAAYRFRWNAWNVEHIAQHGVTPDEAEYVVRHARTPYPRHHGDEKYSVRGPTGVGRHLQVIYVLDPADDVFVIHARPLTDNEKRQLRRSRR